MRKSIVFIVGAGLVLALAIVLFMRDEQTGPTQEAATTSTTQAESGETTTAAPAKPDEPDSASTEAPAEKPSEADAGDGQTTAGEQPSEEQPSGEQPSGKQPSGEQTAALPQAEDQAVPEEESAAKPEAVAPSFDIVRVERSGETVIAGRAAPGSEVIVMRDGEEIGRVTADGRGEWVLLPDRPLPPGSHELSLAARLPDGSEHESEHLVVVYVPEPKAVAAATGGSQGGAGETMEAPGEAETAADESEPQAFAFLVPRDSDGETRVLQGPEIGLAAGALRLDSIYYDEQGFLTLIGRLDGGGRVFAYVDNGFAGEGRSDDADRWQIKPAAPVAFGLHSLRIDQVDEQGQVISRVETPFARSALVADLPDSERLLVVQPGDSLWRLARGAYREGIMYTLLFEANRDQIRDPDLIYPGQIFVVPEAN